ncbi:MAG: hypothetical protein H7144_00670 [Burkholderiales bacterium]|nr:hypothetical protein [Phycisphaerae bacterium]
MLEDLQTVRSGQPPKHAHQQVDLDVLSKLENHSQTVDIDPLAAPPPSIWADSKVITVMAVAGISVVLNLILLAFMFASRKS